MLEESHSDATNAVCTIKQRWPNDGETPKEAKPRLGDREERAACMHTAVESARREAKIAGRGLDVCEARGRQ